ncbi:hypothetical protein [Sandaracinobacteroides saxicola]|uniref:Uncharacterized protein n=1 Tax=Sandaracinobacteroides saxicola TaxID=2759707 RepID=A0A7G5IJ31_9SPHN|nr:hypothetical protein [Sandaracinobacteroides saxicola]QMW23373.1 hypothetical protein H3309_02400 [Sandaracinobacteroides saxicola]
MVVTDFVALARRIGDDPRFPRAAARLCGDLVDFYAGEPLAMRLLGDQGQMRVAAICVYLNPRITVTAVQRLVPAGIASANRVAAAVALLRGQQVLLPVAGGDRRTQVLRLSAEGEAMLGRWLGAFLAGGLCLVEGPVPDPADRALHAGWCGAFVRATQVPGASLKSGPEMERSQSRRGGGLLLVELLRRVMAGEEAGFSRKGFAERFGLSRSQVIALVEEAEAQGWVEGRDGVRLTDVARAKGQEWLMRFLAISVATLEGRFEALVARSRAQRVG